MLDKLSMAEFTNNIENNKNHLLQIKNVRQLK